MLKSDYLRLLAFCGIRIKCTHDIHHRNLGNKMITETRKLLQLGSYLLNNDPN